MRKGLLLVALAALMLLSFIPPSFAYGPSYNCSSHSWHPNTWYVFCESGQTLYANSVMTGSYVFFNATSYSSSQVPEQTFGLASLNTNVTISCIQSFEVCGTISTISVNGTGYLDYNYTTQTPLSVTVGSTVIPSSSYYSTYSAWHAASQPAVWDTGSYLVVKTTTNNALILFTLRYQICLAWVKPDTNPLATQVPTVTYTSNGAKLTSQFGTSMTCFLMDSSTTWTVNNPFYYDNFARTPSTASALVTKSQNYTITYSQNALPVSSNPFTNLVNGQILLGALGPYINLISLQWFLGIILLAICAALYLKSYNPWIPITMLFAFSSVFIVYNATTGVQSLLPNQFNLILYIMAGLGVAGTVYKGFSSR